MGYFASRAAPMGPVPAEVVIATFFNFQPDLVRASHSGGLVAREHRRDLGRPASRWSTPRCAASWATTSSRVRRSSRPNGSRDRGRRLHAGGSTALRRPCVARLPGRTASGAVALAHAPARVPRRRTHRRAGRDRERRVRCNRHALRNRRNPQGDSSRRAPGPRRSGPRRRRSSELAVGSTPTMPSPTRDASHGSGSRTGPISWRCAAGNGSATTDAQRLRTLVRPLSKTIADVGVLRVPRTRRPMRANRSSSPDRTGGDARVAA